MHSSSRFGFMKKQKIEWINSNLLGFDIFHRGQKKFLIPANSFKGIFDKCHMDN